MQLLFKHGPAIMSFSGGALANSDLSAFTNSFSAMMATMPNLKKLEFGGLSPIIMPHLDFHPLQYLTALTSLSFSVLKSDKRTSTLDLMPLAGLIGLQSLSLDVRVTGQVPLVLRGNLSPLSSVTFLYLSSMSTHDENNKQVMGVISSMAFLKVVHLFGVLKSLPDLSLPWALRNSPWEISLMII